MNISVRFRPVIVICFTLVKKRKTGDVVCKDILFTAQSALAAVVYVSLLYYMHVDIGKVLHFVETNFMETSWKREGARASEAHRA